jgi:hypothetical protein
MNNDNKYICKCREPEEIYEIFINEYSFLLCGSCRAEYLKSAANE